MDTQITIRGLRKSYGKKTALDGIDLTVERGMFGLLGRNGAGKTTLMKILATLLPANEGSVTVCGLPLKDAREVRRIIGYLPQDFSMYPGMGVAASLDYLGILSGLDAETRSRRIPELLERVNLSDNAGTKVKALSGGMRRRLGIAQAILHDPKVLIVDEPTAGLDPEERIRFRNLLCEIAENRIVLLSTHIVGDVEASCEQIAVLDRGRLLYSGEAEALADTAQGKVFTALVTRAELAKLRQECIVTEMHPAGGGLTEVRVLAQRPPCEDAVSVEAGMEDAYLWLMGGEEDVR